jgi:hypothetical protein
MKSRAGTLAAPFPYFGGKSLACAEVWAALGDPVNYVEPFSGSAAMLLGRPSDGHTETINDADGFVANFWRAISLDADAVAKHADWPVNEADLYARHSWLVNQSQTLIERLHADPNYFDAKIAGWWCWGLCSWIGDGWCGSINHRLPSLGDAGRGINRQIPRLSAGTGINRQIPGLCNSRSQFIREWFEKLQDRLRNVRVTCGDWSRVLNESVTTRHGLTGVFLDPPYTKGNMDYAVGGVGGTLADVVRAWCVENGNNPLLRIVLCGHAGEHDELLSHGWHLRKWKAHKGYALSDEAVANTASEALWCSPHCIPERKIQESLFDFETEAA